MKRFRRWAVRRWQDPKVAQVYAEHAEMRVAVSAYRAVAQRYFKRAERGLDTRTFEEVVKGEVTHFEMVRRGIL